MHYYHHPERLWHQIFTTPFIYALIVPLAFLDLMMEIYHHICFPAYGIPLVERAAYIRMDRHKLSYLGIFDKVNCAYCGYANGLLRYASKIAQETERYWCSIKHQSGGSYVQPDHQKDFLPYGDEKAFKDFVSKKP